MYHMLPFSYRPEIRSSRRNHGAFQNKVFELVERVLLETEVVDIDNPAGNSLFNSMDKFFSYGLLTADKSYWRCVQQYMPRAERLMLIAECGNANDRYLSIGWLKTAFNKGTLHFYMLSLTNLDNKTYLTRFYHENSCIRNSGLLEAITGYIGKLQHVQFAFYTTRQLRHEPTPAVVIDTAPVSLSSRAAARQRKLTECEASSDMVLNVLPTDVPAILTTTVDQDVLLDEIVRNRRNRLFSEQMNAQKAAYEIELTAEDIDIDNNQEPLEDVLVKTMSAINIDLTAAPLADVLGPEPSVEENTFEISEGEILLTQRDIFNLAIAVFEKPSERVMESFIIFENFHGDPVEKRFFVMTNYNVYILKYVKIDDVKTDVETEEPEETGEYAPLFKLSHENIKCIQMSIDNLSFNLIANEIGFTVYDEEKLIVNEEPRLTYAAAICSHDAGVRMLHALIQVTNFTEREVKNAIEVDDREAYMMLLQPSLTKQYGPTDIAAGFLCYWYYHAMNEEEIGFDRHSGYLYFRKVTSGMSNWLLKNQAEQEQKYCMIIGRKFYVCQSARCKEEDHYFDLRDCKYVQQGRNSFVINTPLDSYEFEATDKDSFSKWLAVLSRAIDNNGIQMFMTPCLNIVTNDAFAIVQEGEKFWTDGFIRFLHKLDGSTMKLCIVVHPKPKDYFYRNNFPVIVIQTNSDDLHYFFVRFVSELDRLVALIKDKFEHVPIRLMDNDYMETEFGQKVFHLCSSVEELWKEA